ncbi:hypothetical protein F4808DRAFT_436799 [Astrocystis sublimbata]|nr:hypothetical protein F4808DRAFT_436799 [Astrocystis sublimbata]
MVSQYLRVRPRPLIQHLKSVTRTIIPLPLLPPKEEELGQRSIVFLQPFKLFAVCEQVIRRSLSELETEVDASPSQHTLPQSNDTPTRYSNSDLLLDLKLLVKFMDEHMKPTFALREKINGGVPTDIEYKDLWHLFKCGSIVLAQSDKSHAYRVLSFTGGRELFTDRIDGPRPGQPPPRTLQGFTINCLYIRFDGTNYFPQMHEFCIRRFSGSQPVTSLPVYPIKFEKDYETKLMTQGKHYLAITSTSHSHKYFSGRTVDEPSHDLDAQVIIDMNMALDSNSGWRLSTGSITKDQLAIPDPRETYMRHVCGFIPDVAPSDLDSYCGCDLVFNDHQIDLHNVDVFFKKHQHTFGPRAGSQLDDEDLMLLPGNIHGFVLRNRQWVTLPVSGLSEVVFQSNFDELMMPDQYKSSIQALVNVHENTGAKGTQDTITVGKSIDLVKGKGVGLVLLLHGEPGVGKTLTAECVADHAKRPLFPITCGDIGETATEVDKNLHHNFNMATKWGCVLLLDEADVFLAKRNKSDLRRNAVTSVFLRSLEYYAGILFLTTNRVGSIDPAFKSRIHISLFYPKFDLEATLRLYTMYINRVKTEQARLQSFTFRVKEKEVLKFAKRHFRQTERDGLGPWNGRQIRNAFQAAIALAEYDSQQNKDGNPRATLGKSQFQIVADSSREFDRYLISTLGAAESDIARREEWRFDRFDRYGASEPRPPVASRRHGFYSEGNNQPMNVQDDDDISSSSEDSDSDSDNNNDDDGNHSKMTKRQAEKKLAGVGRNDGPAQDEDEEYQEYLRFKAFSKK